MVNLIDWLGCQKEEGFCVFFLWCADVYFLCTGCSIFCLFNISIALLPIKKNDGEAKTEKRKKMIKEDNQGKLITKPSVVYNKPYS